MRSRRGGEKQQQGQNKGLHGHLMRLPPTASAAAVPGVALKCRTMEAQAKKDPL